MESFALGDSVLPIPGKVQAETLPRAVIKQGFKHGRGWVLSLPGVPSLAPSGHQGLFLLLSSCPHGASAEVTLALGSL